MSSPGQDRQPDISRLNKCLNERRRRDAENQYIEELAEIISASIADMSNSLPVKPEKCAILQETVKQIKQIKQGGSGGDSAVQQAQVSSSKPAILADDVLGPLLLEALDGFLFVVNYQGKVEFVSTNVTQYLKYLQDDLVGKSVYNIIHVGDHAQFSNSLLPMSVSSGLNWPADNFIGKGRTFNCRLLIKPPCEDNDDVEIKQTYISQYENMQISSILQPYPSENLSDANEKKESQSCLVCIARRLPLAEKTNTMLGVEQFTTRQDLNGKIIECDDSGISHGHFTCPEFVGQNIQEFCHVNDVQQLTKHLQEAITTGHNTSAVYRFRLQENKYVFVQTKSQLFPNPVTRKPESIISTHSIIRECDSENELKGSASTSLMKSIIGPSVAYSKLNSSQTASAPSSSGASNMAVVGNPTPPIIPSMSPGNLFGLNDDIGEDFLNSMGNWDSPAPDNSLAGGLGVSNNGLNFGVSSGNNISATSLNQSWNSPVISQRNSPGISQRNSPGISQIKLSQQMQLQIQRSMSSGGQGHVGNMTSKRPLTLQNINQRSASLDMGQKSPGYSQGAVPTRNQGFQLPGQRIPMGYGGGQRSPAASPSPHSQGRFNVPFQPRTPSPMHSPSPGVGGTGWGHHQPGGLHSSLQSFDSQSTTGQDRLLQQLNTAGLDAITGDKKINKTGKLCQLLTQNSPPAATGSVGKKPRSRHNSRHDSRHALEMSPADSMHQSPQPGPGQSPPEKPQSTSNDDGDQVTDSEKKISSKENVLLKSLLSQDDDMEEMPVPVSTKKRNNSSASQGAEAMAMETKEPLSIEMDKNEAEAKKPNNILLKQLLSTEEEHNGEVYSTSKRKLSETNESLINKLLEDEQKQRECTSAPAESTSTDADLARRRHQSGPQEPQSTTTHSIPMPSLSSPLPSPLTTSFSQSQSTVDTSLLKELFQSSGGGSSSAVTSSTVYSNVASGVTSTVASTAGTLSSMLDNHGQKDINTNRKKFDQLLQIMWNNAENSSDTDREAMCVRNLKRKQSESTLDLGNNPGVTGSSAGGLGGPTASKLSKDNVLLTQLLSKRASDDIVVNTQLTLQPSTVPQVKFSATNLAEKLMKVKPGHFKAAPGTVSSSDSKGQVSRQLEAALIASKGNPSSNQSLESMLGFNQNSNSSLGLGDSASTISNTQFKEQYEELQQLLSQSNNENRTIDATEVDMSENTDPLLAQILQQAQDLQQDLTASATNMNGSSASMTASTANLNNLSRSVVADSSNTADMGSGGLAGVSGFGSGAVNRDQTHLSASQNSNSQSVDILSQLEQVLGESGVLNLSDIDTFLNTSQETSDVNEQQAIDAIQQQLMNEMLNVSSSNMPGSMTQASTAQPGLNRQRLGQNLQVSPSAGSQLQTNLLGSQPDQLQQLQNQFQRRQLQQGLHSQGGYGQPPQGQNFPSQQGPRLPQGSLQGALQSQPSQRPPYSASSRPSDMSLQVRQTLLQQQKIKQAREQKQRQQHQILLQHRRTLLSQQQNFPGSQRFTQDGMPLGTGMVPPPPFPENLADLMNSGTAPNVTLQRNQIPAPMSPRYGQGLQQQQQSPGLSQMLGTNNPQLSPSYPQQQQGQGHWNMSRQQPMQSPGAMGMQPQGSNQYNRHRSLSGGTVQTATQPGNPRFPFTDSPYPSGNQGAPQIGGMFGQQQQQQLFRQNPSMGRPVNIPGRGSPRTSQSPFGASPQQDPLLLSPPEVSPNSALRGGQGQQVSPNYGQGVTNNYGQSVQMSLSPQSQGLTSPQYSQTNMNSQGSDINNMNLFSSIKKPYDVPLSVSTPVNPSQYVKQELRNICNARLEKPGFQSPMVTSGSQLMQQLQQHQPKHETELDTVSELPPDILDQINEMTREHGIVGMEEIKEEKVVELKREEAKKRLENFRSLTTTEDPDKKATSLFRSQLLNPSSNKTSTSTQGFAEEHRVNIVQKEPRTPVEDIKPANHKDSLLQQLLSD